MPRGPKGEKRPADVIGASIIVARIATGEIEDTKREKTPHAVGRGARSAASSSAATAMTTSSLTMPAPWAALSSQIAPANAADIARTVEALQAAGTTSLRGIAAELNNRGIQTPRGKGEWQAGTVSQLLARM
jgi:hypothetical protein